MCNFNVRTISRPEYRAALLKLRDEGWVIEKINGGHLKLSHEKASRFIIAASSPSCNRAHLNVISDCKVALMDVPYAPPPSNLSDKEFRNIMRENKKARRQKHAEPPFLAPLAPKPPEKRHRMSSEYLNAAIQSELEKPKIVVVDKRSLPKTKKTETLPAAEKDTAPQMTDTQTSQTQVSENSISVLPAEIMKIAMDPDALRLVQKIANRTLSSMEITADMVGQTLYYEGELIVTKASDAAKPKAPVTHMGFKPNPAIEEKIIAALGEFGGQLVSTIDLATLLVDDLGYKSVDSARSSLQRKLKKLTEKGVLRAGVSNGYQAYAVA